MNKFSAECCGIKFTKVDDYLDHVDRSGSFRHFQPKTRCVD